MNKNNKISRSQIELFIDCSRCFWLKKPNPNPNCDFCKRDVEIFSLNKKLL
jgi:hypothetical protein